MNRQAVFLDRDGVLNRERGYICRPEDWEALPGAVKAVARLCAAGWPVVVFTNQSAVGRGMMSEEQLAAVHDRLIRDAASSGATIDGIYCCPHAPDAGCDCRKPLPGLLLRAARELNLDLAASYAVGDTPRDISSGRAAGCRTVLVLTGHTATYDPAAFADSPPEFVFNALADFVDWLLAPA